MLFRSVSQSRYWQDVVTEMEIHKRLRLFEIPETEKHIWDIDLKMNSSGIKVDADLIRGALAIDDEIKAELLERSKELTGLENPNSRNQLLEWIQGKGIDVDNIRKETVEKLLEDEIDEEVREVLLNRQELSKTSVRKYEAMRSAMSDEDGKVRGLLQGLS